VEAEALSLKKETGSGSKLGSNRLFEDSEAKTFFIKHGQGCGSGSGSGDRDVEAEAVEVIKFL